MLPRKHVEGYLFFLLRYRRSVLAAIAGLTLFFLYATFYHLAIYTNFFDLYPPNHSYIQLYTKYREMFGTANTVLIVVEMKNGDIFTRPETIQKVDRITLELLHNIPGVNPEQVLSITHPKIKTALTAGSGIKVVPLTYPRLPEDENDLKFFRQKVYTTEGVRGLFVSPDDRATQIIAGFWEEFIDLRQMMAKMRDIVRREEDENHKIYVTGFPILYAYFMETVPSLRWVLLASVLTMVVILWIEFRSWQGVWIPVLSGVLSAIWALGFLALCGLSLDPLVLVIPLLLSARCHSHSVQSMERFHEEYHRLHDRDRAIVKSYTELYAPAMVAILSDSVAIFTLMIVGIPVIQKIAILSGFWIVSIFVTVITLHPVILTLTKPPRETEDHEPSPAERRRSTLLQFAGLSALLLAGGISANLFLAVGWVAAATAAAGIYACWAFLRFYEYFSASIVWLSGGWRPAAMAVSLVLLLAVGVYYSLRLKVGDTTPGAALLYPEHPYNVAFDKVNEHFIGASQLVIIAEGKKREALKNADTLSRLELFAREMEKHGAGGSITAGSLLKKIFRTFHEGDPKWNMLPDNDDHVGQLFFLLTSGTRRGELDRFFDITYTNATITLFYRDYNHDTIKTSITKAKNYIANFAKPDDATRYLLAGGLLGILAATNESVEWAYRWNLVLILTVIMMLNYMTYWSVIGALIVMLPSLIAQPLSEAVMYWLRIDMNINSLPVAAIGIGIGVDYGYYVLSRIVEEQSYAEPGAPFDAAIGRALATTGKTVLFTGLSLTASIVYWVFFPMKFQADMALLLVLLLAFHLIGALVFIPPILNLIRPSFCYAEANAIRQKRLGEQQLEEKARRALS